MSFQPTNQRMFHGEIDATSVADQLAARFNDRQTRVSVQHHGASSLVQIGSKHGTPVTVHITDTSGGVLVSMSRDRNWLDKAGDISELFERASSSPASIISLIPDLIGEMNKENISPRIWNAINDISSLTRALSGERNAPENPKVCNYCGATNDPELELCEACGAALPVQLPRICPKCNRGHTSDALFCQACGTRLVEG